MLIIRVYLLKREEFMSADILILKNLYSKIHYQCSVRFMEHSTEEDACIFPKIINSCERLLKKCEDGYTEKWYMEADDGAVSDNLGNADSDINIGEEIKKAYHSVWMGEEMNQDDVYFLSKKQAFLLDYEEGNNPYSELKRTANLYKERIDLRDADIVKLFEDIEVLLEQEMPLETFVQRANKYFAKCKEFLLEYKK